MVTVEQLKALPLPHLRSTAKKTTTFRNRSTAERTLPPLQPLSDSPHYEDKHVFTHYANWVIPGHLMVGRYPYVEPGLNRRCDTKEKGIKQLKELIGVGLRTFVCLQEELPDQKSMTKPVNGFHPYIPVCETLTTDEIKSVHFPIVDLSIPDDKKLKTLVDSLEQRLSQNERVYLHCWGGRGRAGLVACCLLARAYKISGEEALSRIGRAFLTRKDAPKYTSPQTQGQVEFVKRFSEMFQR